MKTIILDLREVDFVTLPDSWADCPARTELEQAALDFEGHRVKVTFTMIRKELEKP